MTAVCAHAVVTEMGPTMGDACDTAGSGSRARTFVTTGGVADLDNRRAGVGDDDANGTDTPDTAAPDRAGTEPTEVVCAAIRLASEVGDIVVAGSHGDQVYVATKDAVAVIGDAHDLVATIPIAGHPKHLAANADRTRIVVTTYQGPLVIITTTDNTTAIVRAAPSIVEAVSQHGTFIYLGGAAADGTGMISALNLTEATTLTLTVTGRVTALAASPDGRRLYAAASEHVAHHQHDKGWLVVIDTATFTLLDTIAVGASPDTIAASPDGASIYVGHCDTDSITVVDLARGNVTTIALRDSPLAIAVSADGGHLYVINRDSLAIINAATHAVQTIAAGELPRRLEFSSDGKRAYVTHFGGHAVSVIDTLTTAVTATVTVGGHPEAMGISSDGERLYVADYWARTVTVISIPIDTTNDDVNGGERWAQ